MLVVVGPSRHVSLRFTSLALHMSQASEYSCWRFCGRCSTRTAQRKHRSRWCRSLSPIQTRRGTNIAAEVQSPKTRSRRCCETMIFVPSSFIRLSEPISRGTVTEQHNSRTRLRASCPTSRTSEHSTAGARGCDVRMFGCLPLDGPHCEGGLLAELRTYLALKSHNLDATI